MAEQDLDPKVAGHAQGEYKIPEKQICAKHNTYMPGGFCKICMRESDPEYQATPEDRGMNARESAYVRKHKNRDSDEVLAEFRARERKNA